MPNLSIIPAAAVMDSELTPTQLRCLCAVGIHTDKLGGNVWTSVRTLAREANVSERTFQAACVVLVAKGYLAIRSRPGQTNLYEVVLQATPAAAAAPLPPQELLHPTPAIAIAPKRPQRTTPPITRDEQIILDALWSAFPKRDTPHQYIPFRTEVLTLLRAGVAGRALLTAVERYAAHCSLNKTEPQYVKGIHRFFAEDYWRAYDVPMVYGRTREEWARSGQDVLEFDRLLEEASV